MGRSQLLKFTLLIFSGPKFRVRLLDLYLTGVVFTHSIPEMIVKALRKRRPTFWKWRAGG